MKKFAVLFFVFSVLLLGQWKTEVITTVNEPYLDKMSMVTNRDGNHILMHESQNGSIKYYLLSASGAVVRSSTIAASGDFPNIVANNDKVFAVYKSGNNIQVKYSTDAGSNWIPVNALSINSIICNGIDATSDQNGVHVVYSLRDSYPYYETYYYRLNTNSNWVDYQCVTNYGSEVGGYPTVAVSTNRVHVGYNAGYNIPTTNLSTPKERDKSGDTWQTPQTIPCVPTSAIERVAVRGSKLLDFYYQYANIDNDPGNDLFVRERDLDGTTWSEGIRLKYYADPEKLVSTATTNDNKLHILYSGRTAPALYRNYDGSNWSSEFVIDTANLSVSASRISAISNDVFIVWKNGSSPYLRLNQYDATPLAPQNLSASVSSAGVATLNWTANSEPDLTTGHYKVYKATTTGDVPTSYSLVATINAYNGTTPVTSWSEDLAAASSGSPFVYYKITAVDNAGKESDKSQYYVVNNYYLSGTLSANITLTSTHKIGTELLVPSGKTLTVESGANLGFVTSGGTLTVTGNIVIKSDITVPTGSIMRVVSTTTNSATVKIDANVSLTAHGTFYIQGDPVYYAQVDRLGTSGYFGYIIFDGCQSVGYYNLIQYTNILHSSGIKILNNAAAVFVANSTMDYCVQGIYIENSSPWILTTSICPINNAIYGSGLGAPVIGGCHLYKHSEDSSSCLGIYLINNMGPYVYKNWSNDFDIGMYFGGSVVVNLSNDKNYVPCPYPNNRIINNNTGLIVGWGSLCYAGYANYYGYNSIHGNDLDMYSKENSTIFADGNYFGDNGPITYHDGTSVITYAYQLDDDPWINTYSVKPQNSSATATTQMKKYSSKDVVTNVFIGQQLEKSGNIDDAIIQYKKMVEDEVGGNMALTKIALLSREHKKNDLKPYLEEVAECKSTLSNQAKSLIANIALLDGNIEESIAIYDEIINDSSDSYDGINAKFDKLFALLHGEKNVQKASTLLSELEQTTITDKGQQYRLQIADNFINGYSSDGKTLKSRKTALTTAAPKEFLLSNNYPNPFNPSTKISYELPADGFVSVVVYDVLGKEVKTLVFEQQAAGKYTVNFNASHLPSGMYFYTMKAGNFSVTKNMMLL
jgi:hypothetical protein